MTHKFEAMPIDERAAPDGIVLRIATVEDADRLRVLAAEVFLATFGAANTPEDMEAYIRQAFSHEQTCAELLDPGSRFYLAWSGNELVGYAKLRSPCGLNGEVPECVLEPHTLELQRLYVLSVWQGRGVAHALMQECIAVARKTGWSGLWLGVEESNTRAYRFYQKWGFERIGKHTFMLGSDAQTDLVLLKSLI